MPSRLPWVPRIRRAGRAVPGFGQRVKGQGPIHRRFGPYRSTLWPIFRFVPVEDPYPCTLWPFWRLATYPSYPNRIGHPCPRTFSKFSSLAMYPLGLGEVPALEIVISLGKRAPGGLQTLLFYRKINCCGLEPDK